MSTFGHGTMRRQVSVYQPCFSWAKTRALAIHCSPFLQFTVHRPDLTHQRHVPLLRRLLHAYTYPSRVELNSRPRSSCNHDKVERYQPKTPLALGIFPPQGRPTKPEGKSQ